MIERRDRMFFESNMKELQGCQTLLAHTPGVLAFSIVVHSHSSSSFFVSSVTRGLS